MRLTFILSEYPPYAGSGVGTYYAALLPALVARGHDVEVLLGSHLSGAVPPFSRDGVRVTSVDPARVEAKLPHFARYRPFPEFQRSLAAAWAMWEQARGGEGRDVIETVDWGLLFAPWVIAQGPPVVVQLHSSTGQIRYHEDGTGIDLEGDAMLLFESELLAYADALHTHSESNAAWWRAATRRGVDVHPPPLSPVQRAPSGSGSGPLLVAGRVQQWKGPLVLCEALRLLGDDAPEVVWAGRDAAYGHNGSMGAHLAQTYPDVWGPLVRSVGSLPRDDVRRLQTDAAAVLVPSLWDVFNLVAVEAMQAGTPVIVSDGAGAAALIEHGVNGLTFTAGNSAELAECLTRLSQMDESSRRAMGEAGRRSIAQLDPAAVAERKEGLYAAAVLAEGRRGSTVPPGISRMSLPYDNDIDSLGFLDKLPLRALLGYTSKRGATKARDVLSVRWPF